jgi:hypothetical protein
VNTNQSDRGQESDADRSDEPDWQPGRLRSGIAKFDKGIL